MIQAMVQRCRRKHMRSRFIRGLNMYFGAGRSSYGRLTRAPADNIAEVPPKRPFEHTHSNYRSEQRMTTVAKRELLVEVTTSTGYCFLASQSIFVLGFRGLPSLERGNSRQTLASTVTPIISSSGCTSVRTHETACALARLSGVEWQSDERTTMTR